MVLSLALILFELGPSPGCMGDGLVSCPPLHRGAECLTEVYLRVASVMERLTASVVDRPLARLTLSGRYAYENVSVSGSRPHGSIRGNGSEPVKGAEDESDRENLVLGDGSSKVMFLPREGCAVVSVNASEGGSGRLNASESAILMVENESARARGVHGRHHRQMDSPFQKAWVKAVRENAHVRDHGCGHHESANVPT